MGCKQSTPNVAATAPSKGAAVEKPMSGGTPTSAADQALSPSSSGASSSQNKRKKNGSILKPSSSNKSGDEQDVTATLFQMLLQVHQQQQQQQQQPQSAIPTNSTDLANRILAVCGSQPATARYQHPTTRATPLHLAVQLLDDPLDGSSAQSQNSGVLLSGADVLSVVEGLVQAFPDAVQITDQYGHCPLHYAISPAVIPDRSPLATQVRTDEAESWGPRSAVLQLLLTTDIEYSVDYLRRNDVVYNNGQDEGGCTPLYRAIQALPDDFEPFSVTYEFISILRDACGEMVGVGNRSDGDKPLALLYRRFTRQFDLAEKFFEGDNSRPEVVDHRFRYKTAAANTWKIIECLLRPDAAPSNTSTHSPLGRALNNNNSNSNNNTSKKNVHHEWRLVHRAVQVETPPDLLRYIVETNAEDLTQPDADGNLPLHYAARSRPAQEGAICETAFPSFYSKYVVDELLYKFPEAAGQKDANGKYPFTLAVEAGKQWIGGGIKSLYDAFPGALEQVELEEHEILRKVLADDNGSMYPGEEKEADSVIRDEHHDAIMLVQQPKVDIAEVVTSMWAHEEDAGVQMLSCVAITRLIQERGTKLPPPKDQEYMLRVALSAVAAVVNSMKAHPNEVICQEKACAALRVLAPTDGQQEISFVASGAVAAIVGAMQAHVSDPSVQEEACWAIEEIIKFGGSDRATIVGSVSGFTALVNSLAAHPEHVGVQRNACRALDAMTSYTDANLPSLARGQTEPLLVAARDKFPEECGAAVDAVMARLE